MSTINPDRKVALAVVMGKYNSYSEGDKSMVIVEACAMGIVPNDIVGIKLVVPKSLYGQVMNYSGSRTVHIQGILSANRIQYGYDQRIDTNFSLALEKFDYKAAQRGDHMNIKTGDRVRSVLESVVQSAPIAQLRTRELARNIA